MVALSLFRDTNIAAVTSWNPGILTGLLSTGGSKCGRLAKRVKLRWGYT